jgi:hypothetical protein
LITAIASLGDWLPSSLSISRSHQSACTHQWIAD